MLNRFALCAVALGCLCAPVFSQHPYAPAPIAYAPSPAIVGLPSQTEAQASALTDAAGAKASAAKINAHNWDALNQYGVQIGVPLLVRPYGALTNLYAAALPPRSFVGKIDPGFSKDHYGKINYLTGSSIGVAAI